ncbi:glycosyltransferase family 2 protein [Haloplasma contractile]|uniref:Glycoprotein 3-alpha-L-fucosyltransferase n=1 Tax=Haloplasma contractile SSD-17B TaxID=1033810 RepID=F7Q1K6_9MOLU|nr:glycosyltransferase family 2 protein [Haloplasma contractile]ERJ12937.1 glycoprotein 3-alpha-L-fucosyltransferase [Haloplasma contractile SSD-17B]
MNEKISIICPVYNSASYLKQMINCLEFQTATDYKVYFVNDASTDQSAELLDAIHDDRIFVIHNSSNIGAQASREKGYLNATGEYVLFIDSDDYLELDALEKIMCKIKSEAPDIIIYDYRIISEDNKKLYTFYNSTLLYREQFPTNVKTHKELLLSKPGFINKCFKRTLLDRFVTFPNLRIAQDLASVPILIQHAKRISYINEPIYNYRYVHTSISHRVTDQIKDVLLAIDHLREQIDDVYKEELEFIALSHILFQISKLPKLNDATKRHAIYNEFKCYIKTHFPNYKRNKYLKKRGFHRIIAFVFLNETLFFNRLFKWALDSIKGNEFLNTRIYRFDK